MKLNFFGSFRIMAMIVSGGAGGVYTVHPLQSISSVADLVATPVLRSNCGTLTTFVLAHPGAAAAGVSFAVIGAGLAGGLFVFARFFGGGPALAALADSVGKGLGGGARGERASLLRVAAPRGAVSQNAAAERFRGLGDGAPSSAI